MINSNTLQIGNLLLDLNGRICKVESVEPEINNCKIYAIYDPVTTPPFSPLPITEERLRDAGFVPKNVGFPDEYLTFDGKLFWWKVCRNEFFFHKTESGSVVMGAWHDLQNLVRLISGKDI